MVSSAKIKTTITDCFAIDSSTINAVTGKSFINEGSADISNSLYISGTVKKYYDGTFANWVIPIWVTAESVTKTPLPAGLAWIATGGTKVTSINQITALGYSAG